MHQMTYDLFSNADAGPTAPESIPLGQQAVLLRGFLTRSEADDLVHDVRSIAQHAPWRHMETPGGKPMSVATTGCGALGWISDRSGYRYSPTDPLTGQAWPAIPDRWLQHAARASQSAGFANAPQPDACLINRYTQAAKLSLHQDRDERDLQAPIISISLGMPALFVWGGHTRSDALQTVPLHHGDIVVWGGVDRLRFHGVRRLLPAPAHALTGDTRINITLRKAA